MRDFWGFLDKEFYHTDVIIVGGGFFGLSMGCEILENNPKLNVHILERGVLPTGSSSKNAGMLVFTDFASFVDNTRKLGLEKAVKIVSRGFEGAKKLLKRLNNDPIIVRQTGNFSLLFEHELDQLEYISVANKALFELFGENFFEERSDQIPKYGFDSNIFKAAVSNKLGWQIHTGRVINKLIALFTGMGGRYLTGYEVTSIEKGKSSKNEVKVRDFTNPGHFLTFVTNKIALCLNSFERTFVETTTVVPARGQIMLTKPVKDLKLDANFFFEDGYYYFRNLDGRILFGGARHHDKKREETWEMHTPEFFRTYLPGKLREILPGIEFEPDYFWSGIMGFGQGTEGFTITKKDENVISVFGCDGMGMSFGSIAIATAYNVLFHGG